MSGRSAQDKRKSERRAADLTIVPAAADSRWQQPPPDECYDVDPYSWTDDEGNRFVLRLRQHVTNDDLVEFAVVHQAKVGSQFRTVAMADSCNHDDVHVHHYSRRSDARVGDRTRLLEVTQREHLDEGYNLAYDVIIDQWRQNKRRWHDA